MKKKVFAVFLIVCLVVSAVFADDAWWLGKKISGFEVSGLKNVLSNDVTSTLYSFRGSDFTDELLEDMESKLYALPGIKTVNTGVKPVEDGTIKVVLTISEKPLVSDISVQGQNRIRKAEIVEAVNKFVKEGDFVDVSSKLLLENSKKSVKELYAKNGFDSIPVEANFSVDETKNTVVLTITVTEGRQTRIMEIDFSGNVEVSSGILKKKISQKVKSLLNGGYLDKNTVEKDEAAIASYYSSLGYLDVIVSHELTDVETEKEKPEELRTVKLTYKIDEGKKWFYGGTSITGNSVFDDEKVNSFFTLEKGSVLNMESLGKSYADLSDLYYNNGYISSSVNLSEKRDDTTMTVSFNIDIKEGPQATVDKISVNGLTKTLPYVMERELALKDGDVFSKAKLITSAQNLYNTGLLADLDYNISQGSSENSVNIDFNVEEGSHMDIQFGATFGGSASGFPVSGFLQWADHDFKGRGQELSVSTTVSPDSQKLALSFGDGWFKNLRWANSISFSVEHTVYEDILRLGIGADYKNNHYPYPRHAVLDDFSTSSISSADRMSYDLYSASLGYNTGYTFIFDSGRLGLSAGVSGSINKAVYDDSVEPYNETIAKYHNAWKMSNKLSGTLTWDGRDYTINTTKGYIVSLSGVYAGGYLGGISNYRELSLSASAYSKLFEFEIKEKTKRVMFCATCTVSKMYDQFYKDAQSGEWINGIEATDYEYLYIDGMTIARGFDVLCGYKFMCDNMLEVSMPLVDNLLNAEIFASGTLCKDRALDYPQTENGWYFAGGAGVKLKISGFPLGFYIVKNATMLEGQNFTWLPGSIMHRNNVEDSGMKFVLAISTSLI